MVHIPIAVKKIDEPNSTWGLSGALLATFVFGMLLGVLTTGNSLRRVPGLRNLIGAVIESRQEIGDETKTSVTQAPLPATSLPASPVNTVLQSDEILSNPETLVRTNAEALRELSILINRNTVDSERLAKELLRIKNESVELISSFDDNCGNWNDTCATAFKLALDKNNANYDRIVREISALQQEITDAKASQ